MGKIAAALSPPGVEVFVPGTVNMALLDKHSDGTVSLRVGFDRTSHKLFLSRVHLGDMKLAKMLGELRISKLHGGVVMSHHQNMTAFVIIRLPGSTFCEVLTK